MFVEQGLEYSAGWEKDQETSTEAEVRCWLSLRHLGAPIFLRPKRQDSVFCCYCGLGTKDKTTVSNVEIDGGKVGSLES